MDEDDFLTREEAEKREEQNRIYKDEEEMSDSEIRKQMEENDFFQFKKEMALAGEGEFKRRYV